MHNFILSINDRKIAECSHKCEIVVILGLINMKSEQSMEGDGEHDN